MNTGIRNSRQSSITSQDKWKVRLPTRTFAASWGSRSARPIGRVRVRSGCRSACVQVVQGVPSQTAPATRPVIQPFTTERNSWLRWFSAGPRLRSRPSAGNPRRLTASVSRPEPAKSSSTTRRVRCGCRASRSRRLRCRPQAPSATSLGPAACCGGGPTAVSPGTVVSGGLSVAFGPAGVPRLPLAPTSARLRPAPGCTGSSRRTRARGGS